MHQHTLTQLSGLLDRKEISSRELTAHYLDRIAALDERINSVITVDRDAALQVADAADERIRDEGGTVSAGNPLLGMPILHKDIFCTEGVKTSCGSRMLDNFVAPYDATVVTKLRQAGTVMLGKSNMDEFAMGSSNENSFYGPVSNPWDESRVPGGSSGGSAAAVAAGFAPAATATDTGGSIRQPAAFCGVTGLKPTYGRVSRYGMIAFASSLDQGGPIARTAEDCALMLQSMAGLDPSDSTSVDQPVDDFVAALTPDGANGAGQSTSKPLQNIRVGVPKEYFTDGLDAAVATAVKSAIDVLESLGATLVDISLPNQHLCVPAYYVLAPAECSSNLSRFDGVRYGYRCESPTDLEDLYKRSRGEGFGREVKRRILIGTHALSSGYYDAYYLKAQKIRRLISDDFARAFESVDLIAGPATPTTAFLKGSKTEDPVEMYLNDLYTISANLSGLPALSMPCGFADGLPVGLQLAGNYFNEAQLLFAAHQFQQSDDSHLQQALD